MLRRKEVKMDKKCPRGDGEVLIFSYKVGCKGKFYPIFWCATDGNHYIQIDGELVPLIPVYDVRRKEMEVRDAA